MSDERLRSVFAGPAQTDAASTPCPDDAAIWSAAHGESDAEALAAVLDHVAQCAACAESWRMASAIGDEAGLQRRRPAVWAWAAIAAGVLLAALVLPRLLDRGPPPAEDRLREPAEVTIRSALDETVRIARDGAVLRWSGAPEGTSFIVEIAGADLQVLDRSPQLEGREYRIPEQVLADLPAGATVYWRVEATLPDASRVTSPVFLLRLQ